MTEHQWRQLMLYSVRSLNARLDGVGVVHHQGLKRKLKKTS
jgi:hypothetical protein